MTRFGWLVLLAVLLVLGGIIGGWYLVMKYHPPQAVPVEEATTTPEENLTAQAIYTNGVYGFSLVYSEKDVVLDSFANWRSGLIATGTPLVQITDTDGTVRVGASANAREVKACTKASPSETMLPDARFGSTTFKAFTHDNVGTDNQQRITSFRTVHEKACVALESFQHLNGDGTVASSTRLTGIIQSFTFARP